MHLSHIPQCTIQNRNVLLWMLHCWIWYRCILWDLWIQDRPNWQCTCPISHNTLWDRCMTGYVWIWSILNDTIWFNELSYTKPWEPKKKSWRKMNWICSGNSLLPVQFSTKPLSKTMVTSFPQGWAMGVYCECFEKKNDHITNSVESFV